MKNPIIIQRRTGTTCALLIDNIWDPFSIMWLLAVLMLYSHNDINNNNNNRRCKRVYFFLSSVSGDTRRETKILKAYANSTILPPTAWCILWCLRSQHIPANRDSNCSALIRSKKHAARFTGRISTNFLLKNPQILRIISSSYEVNHSIHFNSRPAVFLVWRMN